MCACGDNCPECEECGVPLCECECGEDDVSDDEDMEDEEDDEDGEEW